MNRPASKPQNGGARDRRDLKLSRRVALIVALFCGGFVIDLHTDYIRHFLSDAVAPPPPGLALPPASLAPDSLELDSYLWVRFAQDMACDAPWRLRQTRVDNAPYGRSVYWNSGLPWMLCGLGAIRHQQDPGVPLVNAIAMAAPWVNVILFGATLVMIAVVVASGWSTGAACALVIALPMLPRVIWDFSYARVDHHGQHVFAMLTWILAAVAAFNAGNMQTRRMWFAASGIAAGVGSWIGATQQLTLLGMLCAGAALEIVLRPRPPDCGQRVLPWTVWGVSAALSSLVFYVLENFPDRLVSLRLEVNHPLHALSLLCAGVFLQSLDSSLARRRMHVAVLPAFGLALLPGLVIAGLGPDAHSLLDPFMRRAHQVITEFRSIFATPNEHPFEAFVARAGMAPLFLPIAAILAAVLRCRDRLFPMLCLLLPLAVGLSALTIWQIRWSGMASAAAMCVVCLTAFPPRSMAIPRAIPVGRSLRWIRMAAFVVLAGTVIAWLGELDRRARSIPGFAWSERGQMMTVMRNLALSLELYRERTRPDIVLMAFPDAAPWMAGYRVAPVVGSYYWENSDGLRDTAQVFASQTPDTLAREILRRRGITHVLTVQSEIFAGEMLWIAEGSRDPLRRKRSLAQRLADGRIPEWLEPVETAGIPGGNKARLGLYRVRQPFVDATQDGGQ